MSKIKLVIEFDVRNSAFRDMDGDIDFYAVNDQIQRTVKEIERGIVSGDPEGVNDHRIREYNGNTVGRVKFEYIKD